MESCFFIQPASKANTLRSVRPARRSGWFVKSQGLGNPAGIHGARGQAILKPSGRLACQRHRPIDSRIPALLLL